MGNTGGHNPLFFEIQQNNYPYEIFQTKKRISFCEFRTYDPWITKAILHHCSIAQNEIKQRNKSGVISNE